jgi:hypothetical protein
MRALSEIINDIDSNLAQIEKLADIVADTAEGICGRDGQHPYNPRLLFCAEALKDYAARLYALSRSEQTRYANFELCCS